MIPPATIAPPVEKTPPGPKAPVELAFQEPPARRLSARRGPRLASITSRVSLIAEGRMPSGWALTTGFAVSLLLVLVASLTRIVGRGVGEWGNNQSVAWAWDIVGFVFWIGIGHAGTLISAILHLLRQKWRTSISRAAEAMTLFALAAAAVYPVFHLGRVWFVHWLFPIPNTMRVWPNWTSPLMWDVFAIGTYATVSFLFWYLGLVPDLATLRERARTPRRQFVLGILSLGWRGSQRHWQDYETAYLLFAGLSTPLVLSVHTIVSFDFAASVLPGWHSTVFPPYFVAGAVLSGFAMVLVLMVVVRRAFRLEALVTEKHLENMNKIILATACMVGYSYATELFVAWYGEDGYEKFVFLNRYSGPFAWAYWTMIVCNVILPQVFWFRRARKSIPLMACVGVAVVAGMWLERFVIVVTSLHRDFLPSSWTSYRPTLIDVSTFVGTVGLFLTLFLLFLRYVPIVAMSEVKADLSQDRDPEPTQAEVAVPRSRAKPIAAPSTTIVAWFSTPTALRSACSRISADGHAVDAHTPFPIHGLSRVLGQKPSKLPWIVLLSGTLGALVGVALPWWTGPVAYPIDIGGKPRLPVIAWVPIAFEITILFAAVGCFVGLLATNGLPRYVDPVMDHPHFGRAMNDRFFVSIRATEDSRRELESLLLALGANDVTEVAA